MHVNFHIPAFDFFKRLKNFPHYRFHLLCLLFGQLHKGEAQPIETWGSNAGQTTARVKKGQANNWDCRRPAYGGDVQGES